MIFENKLAPVPAGEPGEGDGEGGDHDAKWQHGLFVPEQSETPVHSQNGQQHHGDDEMRPAGGALADTGHTEQLDRAGHPGENAEQKRHAGRPQPGPRPENVAGPPIEYVRTKNAGSQRNRESNQHRMNGMTSQSDARFKAMKIGLLFDRIDQLVGVPLDQFLFGNLFVQRVGQWFHPLRNRVRAASAMSALAPLAACNGSLSTIDPAGPSALRVADLWWWMLGGSLLLSALVFTLLFMALFRRGIADRQKPDRKGVWIGWLGLAMPIGVLSVLLVYALWVGERSLPTGTAAVRVEATAYNYGWTFCYEDGSCSEGVMRIPAERRVDIDITATDVIHSLWIPRLAGKMDAIPGQVNRLRIEAEAPGRYEAVCAEYCGIGHADHRFVVQAYDIGDTPDALEPAQ